MSGAENTLSGEKDGSVLLIIRSYDEARNYFTIHISVNVVLLLLGIIVNMAICFVMFRGKRYKRNTSNFFILHLSLTELVYRLLVFPLVIYFAVPKLLIKSLHCKLLSFFSETSGSVIFVSLVAIATDRYQHIVRSLQSLRSKKKPVFLVSLVWLYAVIVSCPRVITVESVSVMAIPEARDMECDNCTDKRLCDIPQTGLGRFSITLYFLLAFILPLLAVIILYSKIIIFLQRRSRNAMMHKVAARSKSKAVRMLITTVFGYVFSLSPAVVFALLRSYGVLNQTPFGTMLLVNWMVDFATSTRSLANPLIYAYYNKDFRTELLRLLCRKSDRKANFRTA